MQNNPIVQTSAVSIEHIIAEIRAHRDSVIQKLFREPDLMTFLEDRYGVFQISAVRKEFLKRDLTELKNSSVDLVHYASLIREIKESSNAAWQESSLFLTELDILFKKYGF